MFKSSLFALVILSAGLPVSADNPSSKIIFDEAYAAYKLATENGDKDAALIAAKKTYTAALTYLGPRHDNSAIFDTTATFVLNYGRLLEGKEAQIILAEAIDLLEKSHGKTAIELVEPLMDLANVSDKKATRKLYFRALEILTESDKADSLLAAVLNSALGNVTFSVSHRKTLAYLEKAENILSNIDGVEAELLKAQVHFNRGKYRLHTKQYAAATEELLSSLETFEKHWPNEQLTMTNHAFLIRAYEKRGLRDKATMHCQAIGAARPITVNQDYLPVYHTSPNYPVNARQGFREGSVLIELTVDKNGFATNPTVIESKGVRSFEKAALKAAKTFRYIPKFVDGEAVIAEGVRYNFTFTLR